MNTLIILLPYYLLMASLTYIGDSIDNSTSHHFETVVFSDNYNKMYLEKRAVTYAINIIKLLWLLLLVFV